jgi:hypothetical protein
VPLAEVQHFLFLTWSRMFVFIILLLSYANPDFETSFNKRDSKTLTKQLLIQKDVKMSLKIYLWVILHFVVAILAQECGRTEGISNSIGSEYSKQGEWPWLAPLFRKQNDKFFCSSSIISERFLLSGKK